MPYGVFLRYICLFKFSLSCLQTLCIQIQGKISNNVIALYLLISSKQFTKATFWVERAIGLTMGWAGKAARTKSQYSFLVRDTLEFGEVDCLCWNTLFFGKKKILQSCDSRDNLCSLNTLGQRFLPVKHLFRTSVSDFLKEVQQEPCDDSSVL